MTGGPGGKEDGTRSALDALLDLVVFAPAGLVVSAVEEVPRLAARGRDAVGVRLASAHAVGKMTVHVGGRALSRRLGLGATPPRPARPRTAPPQEPAAEPPPVGDEPRPEAPSRSEAPSPESLPIPDFDALSASQVVQRLDGLSRAELTAVRSYEAGTRGRRTILGRIDQLLA
ncbi:MAG: hypothetical protein M0007_05720 [Actinomycetota bacterium]|jgi:hypothetical protein|nr:hypothetical protein [Actinomycetota bacterium]